MPAKGAPSSMLDWQYAQILAQLDQIQLHASDPSCPCALSDIGEYCLAKHTLLLSSLAGETMAMVAAGPDAKLLGSLQEEATEWHQKVKGQMCHPPVVALELMAWARESRKKLEPLYYACPASRKARPPTPPTPPEISPVHVAVKTTCSLLGMGKIPPQVEKAHEVPVIAAACKVLEEANAPPPPTGCAFKLGDKVEYGAGRPCWVVRKVKGLCYYDLTCAEQEWTYKKHPRVWQQRLNPWVERPLLEEEALVPNTAISTAAKPATPIAPEVARTAVKEPWQMTREEFLRPFYEEQVKLGRVTRQEMEQDLAEAIRGPPIFGESAHKQRVQEALSEGKPVPAEVLAEYPDLAAQAGRAVPRAAVPPVPEAAIPATPTEGLIMEGKALVNLARSKVGDTPAISKFAEAISRAERSTGKDQLAALRVAESLEDKVRELAGVVPGIAVRPTVPATRPPSPVAPKGAVKAEVCTALAEARDIHHDYLSLQPDPKTGSHEWHEHWVEVYDKAKALLNCRKA